MKLQTLLALTLALTLTTLCAQAQKKVETLNNDSIEKADDLKPITVSEHFQALPEPAEDVGLTFSDGRTPQSELGKREKSLENGGGGYRVIDINGPRAPAVVTKGIIKNGPAKKRTGTIRVVEFWATWCGPCKQTIPALTQIQTKFKDQNVQVIGISSEADVNLVRSYVNELGNSMNYTVAFDPDHTTNAPYNSIWRVNAIPHAYLVSHDNKIIWHGHPGNVGILEEAIREAIQYRG